ncbi:MAG: 6-hydroxymethylpterin diphosphokinase MptE-like protein [Thermodesulfobacteriota bacterium]|nr:6-hydroxymethylpterin diphosphokinase MptE-like protein [Thermodesulfobacteriota bacterium]
MVNFYRKNITALKGCAPAYAGWVEAGPPDPSLELLQTPSGLPNLRIKKDRGRDFILYDPRDPMEPERTKAKSVNLKPGRASLIFGLGLGYNVAALAEARADGHVIFVVEENPALVKLALGLVDLSGPLAANALVFIRPGDGLLERLSAKFGLKYRQGRLDILIDKGCRKYFSPEFKAKADWFRRALQSQAFGASVWVQTAARVVENEITNLPLTLLSPGVSNLKNALTRVPAIVVSAGPSLKTSAHLLSRAKGRAVIIAAAPVLRVLLAYDVKPDLAVILDYGSTDDEVLQDVYGSNVPLVFLEQTLPRDIRRYQGRLVSVLQSQGPVQMWLGHLLPDRDHWSVGSNVGSFCLDLALYLGADPIILVGQDLSYPDQTSHGEGVIGRKNFHGPDEIHNQVWLESVGGGRVLSNMTLASFLDEFNQTVARANGRTFINTSLQGARIKGALEMSLSRALESHCLREHDITAIIDRALSRPAPDLDRALDEIAGLDVELEALDVVTTQALDLNQRLAHNLRDIAPPLTQDFQDLLKAHAQCSRKAEEYCRVFEPLRLYLTSAYELLAGKTRLAQTNNQQETMQTFLEKNRLLMDSINQGARRLRALIKEAGQKLKVFFNACEALARDPESPASSKAMAKALAGLGRVRAAGQYYSNALALQPDDANLMLEAAQAGFDSEDLAQAQDLVLKAPALNPDLKDADLLAKRIKTAVQEWLDQASASLSEGDWITALLPARKVLAFDPQDAQAKSLERQCLHVREERIREAEEKTAGIFRANKKQEAGRLAYEAFEAGRHDQVIDLLQGQLNIDVPKDHDALVLLGCSLAETGRSGPGLGILREIQARRPEWAVVPARLGPILIKNGFVEPGVKMLEKAGFMDKNFAHLLFEAGCLRLRAAEHEQAIADFRGHLAANPGSYEAMNNLAVCHLALGRTSSARRYFQNALALKTDSQTARTGLDKCLQAEETRSAIKAGQS